MLLRNPLFLLAFSTAILVTACSEQAEPPATPVEKTTSKQPISGAKLYKRCRTCHTLNQDGSNKVGPNLFGIFGAKAGANEDFRYSKVMSESEVIWTDENLAAYIKAPAKFMPGNSMSFVGIKDEEKVAALLEYMRAETTE